MKVDLEYKYEAEDLSDLVISEHIKKFGQPPTGYRWKVVLSKYDCIVSVVAEALPAKPITQEIFHE